MYKILFVCHGNICRSPMAEFIFNDIAKKRGFTDVFAESAATSSEELGNSVHRGTAAILSRLGIDFSAKRARQITRGDFTKFNLIVAMDSANIRNLQRLSPPESCVITRLLNFNDNPRDISDPWYTGDFERTYRDILDGCEGLFAYLRDNKII